MVKEDLSDRTLLQVLQHVTDKNREFAHYADSINVRYEGATSHIKQLLLSCMVVCQGGSDMAKLSEVLVYETGFNVGCSASAICQALEITGGKLVSFENDEKKRPVADQFKIKYPNIEFVWGDSGATLPTLLDRDQGKVGLFHQDGSHSVQGTAKDVEMALKFLRPGGLLVVDDANSGVVKQVVRKLIGENVGIWLTHQTGQFIYQKS